ncbi:hypothetical protein [Joostella sp. CR20]|uniref:hypothetical protein n=1 Tax=Joostella sp. CR20 TaxID=2804312 RepID=UPI00313DD485
MNYLHKKLVKRVFEEAQVKSGKNSKSGQAEYLSNQFEELGHQITSRTFTSIYNKYVLGNEARAVTLKPELLEFMAKYIGYDSYEDFVTNNTTPSEKQQNPVKTKSKYFNLERIVLYSLLAVILGGLCYSFFLKKEPKCMTWNGEKYEVVSCDISEVEVPNDIIIYDATIYKKQHKLSLSEVKVGMSYYCKMNKGAIEFYAYFGKHPVTKEHLKPVTPYMFNKYVKPNLE